MKHFHYPDGRILGLPNDSGCNPDEGDVITIGRHTGPVVHPKPYGNVNKKTANLPRQPQDPGFRPTYRDVLIEPPEHHGVANPYPTLLLLVV